MSAEAVSLPMRRPRDHLRPVQARIITPVAKVAPALRDINLSDARTAFSASEKVRNAYRIAASEAAMEQLRDGLGNAEAESHEGSRHPERGELSDHEADMAGGAYEREVVDPAIREIAPVVAAMLEAAIAKRLPWTWEPER